MIGGGDDLRHGNPMMPPWPPDRQFSTLLDERYLEDEEIAINLKDNTSPVIALENSNSNLVYVLMPMRV